MNFKDAVAEDVVLHTKTRAEAALGVATAATWPPKIMLAAWGLIATNWREFLRRTMPTWRRWACGPALAANPRAEEDYLQVLEWR